MTQVTIVTGPIRSGTSCITGLLERCGFDLGRNIRILRDETEFNPKGHFEPDLLYTINERLLIEVPGGEWGLLDPPPATGTCGSRRRTRTVLSVIHSQVRRQLVQRPALLFYLTILGEKLARTPTCHFLPAPAACRCRVHAQALRDFG